MSNLRRYGSVRSTTFKQVDVGQAVELNDDYLVEHNRSLQIESIAVKTMANAEQAAQETLIQAQAQAQELIANAQAEAQRIVETEGHQQRDAILKQGYEEGFQAGLEQGYVHFSQEVADQIALADSIVAKAYEAQALLANQQQAQLVALVQYILSRILHHEIQAQPGQIAALIQQAAEQIPRTGSARILIHPETFAQLKDWSPEAVEALSQSHHITFHPTPTCQPQALYLETLESSYEISPETQAQVLLASVQAHLDSALPLEDTDATP